MDKKWVNEYSSLDVGDALNQLKTSLFIALKKLRFSASKYTNYKQNLFIH